MPYTYFIGRNALRSFLLYAEGTKKAGIVLALFLLSLLGNAQVSLYTEDFGDGSSLPTGWTVTAGTSPGFAAINKFITRGNLTVGYAVRVVRLTTQLLSSNAK